MKANNNMEEIWKDIEGYNGYYQISNHGRVKSLQRLVTGHKSEWQKEEKIMKLSADKKGYSMIRLTLNSIKKTFTVHRLVALHFIERVPNKNQINHIDCDKTNNTVENLEWCDNSKNQTHAFQNGLNKYTQKHREARIKRGLKERKLNSKQVEELKELRNSGFTYKQLSERFGISGKMAEEIYKGKKYKNEHI